MSSTFIHPAALVETEDLGEGTRVWAFAHVMRGARVGRRCNLGEGVFLESGVVVGDDVTIKNGVALYKGVRVGDSVFLGPHCVFTNDRRPRSGRFKRSADLFQDTTVEHGASIGANATIVCGLRIGRFAMVAAGAVVTKDVPAFALVAGVPSRQIGLVCACGERLHDDDLTCRCGISYRREGATISAIEDII